MKQLIISILVLFSLASFNHVPTFTSESNIKDKPAPSFTLPDLNGNKVSLSDYKGKVVILDFWATWCPPCVKEIPHFIELYKEYKDQGLSMVGISVDRQGIGIVKAFIQKYKINYPILMADSQVTRAYGNIRSIPTTFVIDPAGNLQRMYVGYREKSVFETDIKTLLPDVKLAGTEKKDSVTTTNKYVTELNNIGIAGLPENDNAAPYYLKAIELYIKEPEGLNVKSKRWPNEMPAQEKALLKKWVQDNSRALEQLELGSNKPYCWFKQRGQNLEAFPHGIEIRELVYALQARLMLQAENDNTNAVINDIITLYNVGSQIEKGPKPLNEKIFGIAVKSISIRAAFYILDKQILNANLIKTLEDRLKPLMTELNEPFDIRGEKIFMRGQIETDPRNSGFESFLEGTLKYIDVIASTPPWELRKDNTNLSADKNPLTERMGSAVAQVMGLGYQRRVEEQALITTLAILRYNSDKNGYPANLSELISAGHLKELPIDPYSDKSFVYKRTQAGFILYSYGGDYDDDGGQYSKWGLGEEGGDQVFWPVEKRQ